MYVRTKKVSKTILYLALDIHKCEAQDLCLLRLAVLALCVVQGSGGNSSLVCMWVCLGYPTMERKANDEYQTLYSTSSEWNASYKSVFVFLLCDKKHTLPYRCSTPT